MTRPGGAVPGARLIESAGQPGYHLLVSTELLAALAGGAFALGAVYLQQLLAGHSEKKQREDELRSLLLLLSWELQVLKASIVPREPAVRLSLASLTWLTDRGFLGRLPAKLRDAILTIGTTVQLANELNDVIGPRPTVPTGQAMRHQIQFSEYGRRLQMALDGLRETVPIAIEELNQLLPKFKVKVSDGEPGRSAPTPDPNFPVAGLPP